MRDVFASIIDGVVLIARDLRIKMSNEAAEEMFRQSRDFLRGKPVGHLFPGQPEIRKKAQQTARTGISFRDVECRGYRGLSQTEFPAALTISPCFDGRGQAQGAVLTIKDTSLQKELEAASRQFDHMSALGVIAKGLAHEIKNPLAGIRGSAQLLKSELTDPGYREYLEVVVKEVDRINRMIAHMLDFADPQKLQPREVNIHKILDDIILLEKRELAEKGGAFIQDYDPSLPGIEADEDKLKQVFLNLMRNALEATPPGKDIRVVTRISAEYTVKPEKNNHSRMHILVEIIDSGPGIPEAEQKKLFTPFYTTKKKGTGLGLAISLKIIEDHQGKIKVHSGKNGTAARVVLPLRQERP